MILMREMKLISCYGGGTGKVNDFFVSVLTNFGRQIFLLYTDVECLPSKDSVLARICQKCAEYKERQRSVEI